MRLTAQSHQKHYASKLADAQVKLDAAEAVANRTRTEFEVLPNGFRFLV